MIELIPLFTAVVDVEPTLSVGAGPAGPRSVSAISSVTITGDRLKATLAGPVAADWMVRNGAIGVIDVRLTVRTDDGALIYIVYAGRLDLSNPAQGITAYVGALFETGDERYTWLNRIQGVGKAKLTLKQGGAARLDYEFYEVR